MVNVNAELIAPNCKKRTKKKNPERNGYHTDTVMCRGHLECQEKVCKQVIKNIS